MKLKTVLLLIPLSLPLTGCGNKGPLVLPQAPVSVDAPVPADEVPAEPVPADANTPPPATPPTTPDPVPRDGKG